MKFFQKKKFKYGAFAIALTAAIIAVVIVVNVIFASLSSHYLWYADMTAEKYYELTDTTCKLLDTVDKEQDITIYFFTDKDKLEDTATSNNYYGQSGWGMKYIHEIALQIAERYDFVKVAYLNLGDAPDTIKEIVGDDYYKTHTFSSANVIVDNNRPETDANGQKTGEYYHDFRIFTRDDFYAFNYSTTYVSSFRGEYRFASAISAISEDLSEVPTVYFLTGHGEPVGSYFEGQTDTDATANYGQAHALWQFYRDAGFAVRKINLQYENLEPEGDAIVVEYAPKTDLVHTKNSSELDKLNAYLGSENHHLFVLMEPTSRELSNLEGLLAEKCGVSFAGSKIKASGSSSVSTDGYTFASDEASDGKGAELLKKVSLDGKTVFTDARPLKVSENAANTSVVAYVPEGSELINGEEKTTASKREYALLTVSEVNGSKVMLSGATTFASGAKLDSDIYKNRDLLLVMHEDLGDYNLPSNIQYKLIRSEGLDLTVRQARIRTVIFAIAIPALIGAVGVVVYVRRRHS